MAEQYTQNQKDWLKARDDYNAGLITAEQRDAIQTEAHNKEVADRAAKGQSESDYDAASGTWKEPSGSTKSSSTASTKSSSSKASTKQWYEQTNTEAVDAYIKSANLENLSDAQIQSLIEANGQYWTDTIGSGNANSLSLEQQTELANRHAINNKLRDVLAARNGGEHVYDNASGSFTITNSDGDIIGRSRQGDTAGSAIYEWLGKEKSPYEDQYQTLMNEMDSIRIPSMSTSNKNTGAGSAVAEGAEDYQWNKEAEIVARLGYEQEALKAKQEALATHQEFLKQAQQNQVDYAMKQYSANQSIEKAGWTGGYVLDSNRQVDYMRASIAANLYTQAELQRYGYETALAAAVYAYKQNMYELSLEYYDKAVTRALNEAGVTGVYISPEVNHHLAQLAVAEKENNAEKIKAINNWFTSQGISKQGIKTLASFTAELQATELKFTAAAQKLNILTQMDNSAVQRENIASQERIANKQIASNEQMTRETNQTNKEMNDATIKSNEKIARENREAEKTAAENNRLAAEKYINKDKYKQQPDNTDTNPEKTPELTDNQKFRGTSTDSQAFIAAYSTLSGQVENAAKDKTGEDLANILLTAASATYEDGNLVLGTVDAVKQFALDSGTYAYFKDGTLYEAKISVKNDKLVISYEAFTPTDNESIEDRLTNIVQQMSENSKDNIQKLLNNESVKDNTIFFDANRNAYRKVTSDEGSGKEIDFYDKDKFEIIGPSELINDTTIELNGNKYTITDKIYSQGQTNTETKIYIIKKEDLVSKSITANNADTQNLTTFNITDTESTEYLPAILNTLSLAGLEAEIKENNEDIIVNTKNSSIRSPITLSKKDYTIKDIDQNNFFSVLPNDQRGYIENVNGEKNDLKQFATNIHNAIESELIVPGDMIQLNYESVLQPSLGGSHYFAIYMGKTNKNQYRFLYITNPNREVPISQCINRVYDNKKIEKLVSKNTESSGITNVMG